MQNIIRVLKMSLVITGIALIMSLSGCASEPFVTDEDSAAAQHADRQNVEFQEKGVPNRRKE
jgi:PBP1b-binding outer membrane lipoprotein LpoB